MSLIAPLGQFLTQFDTAITAGQAAAVSGLVTAMKAPVALMGVIYLALMGWRVAAGDLDRLNAFTFDMAKIGIIFAMATNLATFNYWVVGVFEHGFADSISTAVTGGAGAGQAGSVGGVAKAMDRMWGVLWLREADIMKGSSQNIFDFASPVIAAFSVLAGAIGLVLIAGVYLIARFLFAVVVVLGPVAIACAMFAPTRPIFERWIGKGVSMIVLQVSAIITLQIVLKGANTFEAVDLLPLDLPTQIQNLIAMVIWIAMGAFAVYSLPTLAYSIGTGVAISFTPIVAAALAAATAAAGLPSFLGGGGASGGSGGSPNPNVNLSMNRAEVADPAGGFLQTSATEMAAPPLLLPPPTPLLSFDGD